MSCDCQEHDRSRWQLQHQTAFHTRCWLQEKSRSLNILYSVSHTSFFFLRHESKQTQTYAGCNLQASQAEVEISKARVGLKKLLSLSVFFQVWRKFSYLCSLSLSILSLLLFTSLSFPSTSRSLTSNMSQAATCLHQTMPLPRQQPPPNHS